MRLSDIGHQLRQWKLPLLIASSILVLILLWSGDVIRPGSMGRSGRRNVKPLPVPIWLMVGFLIYLAPGMIHQSLEQVPWIVGQDTQGLQATAAPITLSYFLAAIIAIGLMVMTHKAAPEAGLKIDWIDPPIGLGLLILSLPLVLLCGDLAELINQSLSHQQGPPSEIAHPLLQLIVDNRHEPWTWALIAAVIVAVPIVEEAIFRVYLQSALQVVLRNTWAAIFAASAIFGTLHAIGSQDTSSPWYAAVQVGMLGVCMGAAYERTKRVGVPIAMHAAFNALNVAMALWSQ